MLRYQTPRSDASTAMLGVVRPYYACLYVVDSRWSAYRSGHVDCM